MASPFPRVSLDQINVAEPCHVAWDAMRADGDGGRHCSSCAKRVHDLSTLSRREVEALLTNSDGAPCVRITRSPDGRVLTREDFAPRDDVAPREGLQIQRRALLRRVAAVAASLGLGAMFNVGCERRDEPMSIVSGSMRMPAVPPAVPTTTLGEVDYTDAPPATKPTTEPVLSPTMGVIALPLPPATMPVKGKLARQ